MKELPIHFTPGPQLEDGFHVKLKEQFDVSVFVLAAGSTSIPRYELRGLPCLRAFTQGTRFVFVVAFNQNKTNATKQIQGHRSVVMPSADAVLLFLQAARGKQVPHTEVKHWCTNATAQEIKAFSDAGHKLYCVTVGTGDLLYTPAGYMIAHKIMNNVDCVGFRVGCWSPQQGKVFESLLQISQKPVGSGGLPELVQVVRCD